jgi:hypothetical protein
MRDGDGDETRIEEDRNDRLVPMSGEEGEGEDELLLKNDEDQEVDGGGGDDVGKARPKSKAKPKAKTKAQEKPTAKPKAKPKAKAKDKDKDDEEDGDGVGDVFGDGVGDGDDEGKGKGKGKGGGKGKGKGKGKGEDAGEGQDEGEAEGETDTPAKKPAKRRAPAKAKGSSTTGAVGSVAISGAATDQDLLMDPDLRDVIPRIRSREAFWTVTDEDARAVKAIREAHPRRLPPKSKSKPAKGKKGPSTSASALGLEEDGTGGVPTTSGGAVPAPGAEDLSDGYDSFDEGVGEVVDDSEQGVVGLVLIQGEGEVPVVGRTRWQRRYIMAKAKMMLVEEENGMRKAELRALMDAEREMFGVAE